MSPFVPYDAPQGTGKMLVAFGITASGKTTSVFASIKKYPGLFTPAIVFACEQRNIEIAAETVDLPRVNQDGSINYILYIYDNFQDLSKDISNMASLVENNFGVNYDDVKLEFLDGGTQLMSNVSFEIADIAAEARASKDTENIKDFILQTKLSIEGYGSLGDHMQRLLQKLVMHTRQPYNKFVVLNMLLEEESTLWDNTQRAVPSLMGNQFPKKYPGQVDYIGLVEDRYIPVEIDELTKEIKSIKKVYPPWIKFEEDFDVNGNRRNFIHKWTGKRPVADDAVIMCPFDLKTIFYPPIHEPSINETKREEATKQEINTDVEMETIENTTPEKPENVESQTVTPQKTRKKENKYKLGV